MPEGKKTHYPSHLERLHVSSIISSALGSSIACSDRTGLSRDCRTTLLWFRRTRTLSLSVTKRKSRPTPLWLLIWLTRLLIIQRAERFQPCKTIQPSAPPASTTRLHSRSDTFHCSFRLQYTQTRSFSSMAFLLAEKMGTPAALNHCLPKSDQDRCCHSSTKRLKHSWAF